MSSELVYTPILKGKANDLKALGKMPRVLSAQAHPLVEMVPPKDDEDFDRAYVRFAGQFRKHCSWQAVSIDLHAISPNQRTADGSPALETCCAYLRGIGIDFRPVFGFDQEPELWDRVLAIARRGGRGITFRLKIDDIEEPDDTVAEILSRLRSAGISPREAHLVLDLASLADVRLAELARLRGVTQDFVDEAKSATDFSLISIVGSSMPRDVTDVPKEGLKEIPRRELRLWTEARHALGDSSLAFGDYSVIHPNFSDKNPATNANGKIRYTAGIGHHIFRGYSLRQQLKYGQYRELAARVVGSSIFHGRDFSFGDTFTWDCAHGLVGTGNLGTWVEVDVNRHLVFVTSQVGRVGSALARGASADEVLEAQARV